MIVESASHLVKLKLMEKKDCAFMREEEFSYLLASTCESIIQSLGIPYPYKHIKVEELYYGTQERCDIVIENKEFNLPYPELNHKTHIECKFFRSNATGGNSTTRAKSLWKDFRKVINLGKEFPYSVVLCENDYNEVFPTNGIHGELVTKCFDPKSNSIFSLWEDKSFSQSEESPFHLSNSNGKYIELKVSRSFTEPFPIKFNSSNKLFRVYIFRLYSKDKCCQAFEF